MSVCFFARANKEKQIYKRKHQHYETLLLHFLFALSLSLPFRHFNKGARRSSTKFRRLCVCLSVCWFCGILKTFRSEDAPASKRRLKSPFKCRRTLLELNSQEPYRSLEGKRKFCRGLFASSTKREIRHLHGLFVQKSVMFVQSCCFANQTYCFFEVHHSGIQKLAFRALALCGPCRL